MTLAAPPWGQTGAPIWVMLHISLKLSSILIFDKINISKIPNEQSVEALAAKKTEKIKLFAFFVANGAQVKSV